MRIYYVMEDQGRRCHVLSALGVDARTWNRLHRRVRDWRRQLAVSHGIPATYGLNLAEMTARVRQTKPFCDCSDHAQTASTQGVEVAAQGLRVV